MANYSLTVNSRFRPFSFERYIQPLQIYGQAYKEQEDAMTQLAMQANTIKAMINETRDPKAAERYRNYMEGLEAQADALSREGLLPGVRTSVNNLRSSYVSDVLPIQKAYETMMKQIEEQRKYGDTRINEYNASQLSIDDFLDNPEKSFRSVDRDKLYTLSAATYGALQKELRDYSLQEDPKIKDKFQKAFIQKYGRSPEEVTSFINNMREQISNGIPVEQAISDNPMLSKIFRDIYEGTGIGTWGSRDAAIAAANTILAGATSAIGKDEINLATAQDKVLEAQYNNAVRLAKAKGNGKGPTIPSRTAKKRTFATRKDRAEGVNDWLKYGKVLQQDEDGNWVVNKTSKRLVPGKVIGHDPATGVPIYENNVSQRYVDYVSYDEEKFLKKYGLIDSKGNITSDQALINKVANKYNALINDSYDQLGYNELFEDLDKTEYPKVMSTLTRLAVDNKVKTMDYEVDQNGVPIMSMPGTSVLDLSSKKDSDITGARNVISAYKDDKGQKLGKAYLEVTFAGDNTPHKIPISQDVESNTLDDAWYMIEMEDAINSGVLSPEDMWKASQRAAAYENSAFDNMSRYFGTTRVKPHTVKMDDVQDALEALISGNYDNSLEYLGY